MNKCHYRQTFSLQGGNFDGQFDADVSGEISPIRLRDEDFFPFGEDTRSVGEKYCVADFCKEKDDVSSFADSQGKRKKRTKSQSSASEEELSVNGDHYFKSLKAESQTPDETHPMESEEAGRYSASVESMENFFTESRINLPGDPLLNYFPRGLFNSSIFCYLNSGVQALGNIPQFSLGIVMSTEAKEHSLLHAL